MTTRVQQENQQANKPQEREPMPETTSGKTQIPDSWQLTKEQKEFIDLFSEDDDLK